LWAKKVTHRNPDIELGKLTGKVIWVDSSGTLCRVQFERFDEHGKRMNSWIAIHPLYPEKYSNRFNDPVTLPVSLVRVLE
jgi:hypothetical protein